MSNYTNLTDAQWQAIVDIVRTQEGGAPEKWARRDIVDAILYKIYMGCTWRQIPDSYPNWNTVFVYYNRWRKSGTWHRITFTLYLPQYTPSDPSTNNSYIDVTVGQRII